jgi:hypothetical protein
MSLYNFYRSKEWEELLVILKSERLNSDGFIVCEHCGKPIVKAYDCIGHHIVELTEENYTDAHISLNPQNIALVHHKCHNKIHNKLGYSQRQVFIVYGSPLSGKTSYVYEVMDEGDLIVDLDNIWQCVSGCSRYTKPPRLKSVVFGVRDKLLDDIKIRRGKWSNAYVVGGYPYQMERQRLADTLGAREIFIDTDKATCIERLANCEDRNHEEWMRYIDDWWLQFGGGF